MTWDITLRWSPTLTLGRTGHWLLFHVPVLKRTPCVVGRACNWRRHQRARDSVERAGALSFVRVNVLGSMGDFRGSCLASLQILVWSRRVQCRGGVCLPTPPMCLQTLFDCATTPVRQRIVRFLRSIVKMWSTCVCTAVRFDHGSQSEILCMWATYRGRLAAHDQQ